MYVLSPLASKLIIDQLQSQNAAKKQLDETLAWRKSNEIDLLPCATRQNGLPLLVAIRGFESFDDGNVQVKPGLSDSVVRISNLMGGDCIHKVDREGHPLLIDRTVRSTAHTQSYRPVIVLMYLEWKNRAITRQKNYALK